MNLKMGSNVIKIMDFFKRFWCHTHKDSIIYLIKTTVKPPIL